MLREFVLLCWWDFRTLCDRFRSRRESRRLDKLASRTLGRLLASSRDFLQ